jgi:hypothetical protein
MSETGSLSLQNFTSIFEIFAGYYLLLGTNKSFNDYFNIVGVYKSWRKGNEGFSARVKKLAAEMEKTSVTVEPVELNIWQRIQWHNRRSRELTRMQENYFKAEALINQDARWDKQLKLHYDETNPEAETDFYKFMKPFYIFFGSLSMCILLMCGFCDQWNEMYNLNVLNILSGAVVAVLLRLVLRNKFRSTRLWIFPPQYSFILSLVLFPVLIFLPSRIIAKWQFISQDLIPHGISYNDLQVLAASVLIFFPIVIHLGTVLCLMVEQNVMKWKFQQITLPEVIKSAKSSPQIPRIDGAL